MPKRAPFRHLTHLPSFREQPIVFFTVVTHGRQQFLATDFAHRLLLGIWQRSGDENGWFVGDYILMPDHVHLFARPAADAETMSRWIKMWKSVSSRQLVRATGIPAPIWQQEYFDRFLRSEESYDDKWCYVHNNPVRAGLVTDADAWPFRGRIFDLGEAKKTG
jgi:REP element-mobilizing transposase RayT